MRDTLLLLQFSAVHRLMAATKATAGGIRICIVRRPSSLPVRSFAAAAALRLRSEKSWPPTTTKLSSQGGREGGRRVGRIPNRKGWICCLCRSAHRFDLPTKHDEQDWMKEQENGHPFSHPHSLQSTSDSLLLYLFPPNLLTFFARHKTAQDRPNWFAYVLYIHTLLAPSSCACWLLLFGADKRRNSIKTGLSWNWTPIYLISLSDIYGDILAAREFIYIRAFTVC